MVRDVTLEPAPRELLHVDFVRILLDRKMKIEGARSRPSESPPASSLAGLLDVVTRELEIECLPADIPASIPVDVSALGADEVLRVADLNLGDKFRILGAPDRVLAHVVMPRAEVVPAAATAAPAEGAAELRSSPRSRRRGRRKRKASQAGAAPKGRKAAKGVPGDSGRGSEGAEKKEKK